MTCRQFIEFLSDFRDGELPRDQRLALESHLRTCAECRRYVEQFNRTVNAAQSLGSNGECNVPEDLVRAILKAAKQEA
jgi:anti-sigma factor RsiW